MPTKLEMPEICSTRFCQNIATPSNGIFANGISKAVMLPVMNTGVLDLLLGAMTRELPSEIPRGDGILLETMK